MRYTLDQACERLANYSHAYGVTNVRESINSAIQALAGLNGWECLRRVVRFSSAGPAFALPQGCAGLVRACVNGRPATMRGQDFRFLQSGPGDEFSRPSTGFSLVAPNNIESVGYYPLIFNPVNPFCLAAFSDGGDEPPIVVKGYDTSGKAVRVVLPMSRFAQYDNSGALASGCEPEDAPFSDVVLSRVESVVVDKCASKYITLYAKDTKTGDVIKTAYYHPSVRVPLFKHYQIRGIAPGQPVEILAEVRVDPLPLIDDTDVLPFDGIEPIEYMILYAWKMQSSEIDAARKYKEEAASWLRAQEITENTVQTTLLINGTVTGSMGDVSMEAENI